MTSTDPSFPERPERKLATVLFADLVSSTALGSAEDPEETRVRLDRFYEAMTAELVDAGGTVEKFAGDAVLAVFGVPVAREDHVERALHAALAMQQRLGQTFAGELALRIGVDTGEVVVGAPRAGSSFASGDTVNVAARLEQAAAPGEILVGSRAAALVAGAFEFEEPKTVDAKGKQGGVECRTLVRALSLMRPRGVPGLNQAFVGRESELGVLREAFARGARVGQPQLVTIAGEPGVGKTRLVREVWDWLGQTQAEAARRTGRCVPYGLATTYRPIRDILEEHYGILESDPVEHVLSRLGERRLLGLALGLDVAGELHPIEARDRLEDAWIELVTELAAERPLVLLVEDLHWAEQPLLEVLERMLLEARGPILLVATARPEFLELSPTWGRGRVDGEWVWLEPLAPDDVERLVAEAVSAEAPVAARELLARAEGNPLFVEELLATLIQRGALDPTTGWELSRMPVGTTLPDSVRALLAARIDLLAPEQKAALQAASVIGHVFWPSALQKLLAGSEPDLATLERRDFVRRRSTSSLEGERELVFKHALTREVAYASLTRRERARLHAELASWFETREEDAGRLAFHYAEAVRPEDAELAWGDEPERLSELQAGAFRWLRRAAELAVARYEIAHGITLLERALALASDRDAKAAILQQIGRAHGAEYDLQRLRESFEAALALEPEQALAAELFAELAYLALARPYMWKDPPPRAAGEAWLGRALSLARPGSAARAFALLAEAGGNPETGAEAADEALEIGRARGSFFLMRGLDAKTLVATAAGEFAEASAWADQALEAGEEMSHPGDQVHRLWLAGLAHLRAGRLSDVRALAEAQADATAVLGPHDEVHLVAQEALLESVFGNWQALAGMASRAEAKAAANTEFPCQFNWRTLVVCALGATYLGRLDEAERLVRLAEEGATVFGPVEREPALLRLSLLRGDLDEVGRILELMPTGVDHWGLDAAAARLDALAVLGRSQDVEAEALPFLERESYTRPFALRALGLTRGDTSLVERAAAGFASIGLDWRATETRALVARASR